MLYCTPTRELVSHVPQYMILDSKAGTSIWQFIIGAWLWVTGQQVGSLACTGLGYWVVFDAFGVALGHVLPSYLAGQSVRVDARRPYGCVWS